MPESLPVEGPAEGVAHAVPGGRAGIEALPMRVHTVLNRVEPSRPAHQRYGFGWTLNPYRGCAFACRYCYARYTHEWLGLDGDSDFDRRIRLKQDIAPVLERDLDRMQRIAPTGGEAGRREGAWADGIAIGTATDPYQPLEQEYGLTRACLEVFARRSGLRISLTTKSNLVLRDVDLLREVAARNDLTVHVTITTLDRALARSLEPGAPSPRARLAAVEELCAAGLRVEPFVCPLIPGLTDGERDLERLFAALARAGASRVVCEAIFLRSPTREIFLRHLEDEAPELVERYRRRFAENAYLPPLEVERLRARIDRLRRRFGLVGAVREEPPFPARLPRRSAPRRMPRRSPPAARTRQLGLFG